MINTVFLGYLKERRKNKKQEINTNIVLALAKIKLVDEYIFKLFLFFWAREKIFKTLKVKSHPKYIRMDN